MNAPGRLAVVAHDAGGAQVLASYVRRQGPGFRAACVFALAGPAAAIFESRLGRLASVSPEEAIAAASSLLCGTGWQSDWELRALAAAAATGKRSVAFLDHWVNYRERFMRPGRLVLPDELWVGDPTALALAQEQLPELPVRLVENPYLLDVRDELSALPARPPSAGLRMLYVCEPVREHALRQFGDERHWGYTEEEALRYFLDHADAIGEPIEAIVVRPHPSEARDKYAALLRSHALPVHLSDRPDLLADIAAADVVVGCNSMAMVIGLVAARRVVCSIPPDGRPCVLPHPEIENLRALASSGKSQPGAQSHA